MNNERYPKIEWQARQQGKRPRGSPRQTREDGVKDVLKRKGMAMTQAKNWAKDRARWRALCKEVLRRKRCSLLKYNIKRKNL
jgi:hypothetical protein